MKLKRSVTILAGSGPFFGQGHMVRSHFVADAALVAGLDVKLVHGESYDALVEQAPAHAGSLFLLDARDVDPRPFLAKGDVIALDNRHEQRPGLEKRGEGLVFWDTIPHPKAPLAEVLDRCLIDPIFKKEPSATPRQRSVLLVPGSLIPLGEGRAFVDQLVNQGVFDRAAVAAPNQAGSTGRTDFAREVMDASCVIAYFGMALMEAWFTGAVPLIFETTSDVHRDLTRYLGGAAELPMLSTGDPQAQWIEIAVKAMTNTTAFWRTNKPTGRGLSLLVGKIVELTVT